MHSNPVRHLPSKFPMPSLGFSTSKRRDWTWFVFYHLTSTTRPLPYNKTVTPTTPLPPKTKISNNRKHTTCSVKVCCVLFPSACEPGDDLKSPTICDEKTDGLLQPPNKRPFGMLAKKTWENQMRPCVFLHKRHGYAVTCLYISCIQQKNMFSLFFWGEA